MRANFSQNRGFNITSNYRINNFENKNFNTKSCKNYTTNQANFFRNAGDIRKRSSPPGSKVSYHSHYIEHDGSPESLTLENIKGPGPRNNENANASINEPQELGPHLISKSFIKSSNYISDQLKSQSSRLQNYRTAYFKNQVKEKNLRIEIDKSHTGMPETSLNES